MARFVILAINTFDYLLCKTGNMLIRYRPSEVVAVIDPSKTGQTAQEVLGYGGSIPVVANYNEAANFTPDTLVIGNAPQGGFINTVVREELLAAIQGGCNIINGMHQFLNDDPEIRELADRYKVTLTDLRRPPEKRHFPKGSWRNRKIPVLLVTGTDCDTGKMTTAWELNQRLTARGWRPYFVGTGQTGILLSGTGVPIDAVVADFMAGEMEYVLDQAGEVDVIIVEGQGSLTNMYYSGVTLGILHGCMPDFLIMTHEPHRKLDVTNYLMVDLKVSMDLHIKLMQPFKPSRFLGVNLLTLQDSEPVARRTIRELERTLGIPVTDLIRFGDGELLTSIETALKQWT
jgi:uncharacterized NAD-dependent epimerase/dehydratase family protein